MVAVELRVLGQVEVLVDGHRVDIGHARRQSVMAVMVIDANRPIAIDQLAERVWGTAPAAKDPRAVLRTYLWHLRRTLAPVAGVELVRQASGYRLDVDERCVDLHRFRRLLASAHSEDNDGTAGDLIEQALRLWRAEPFAGLDSPWLDAARQNLMLQRQAARLELTDHHLRRGRHSMLLAELADHAAEHPLDERITAQLMLALYRSGRADQALAQYRRACRILADELGTGPCPDLQRLHQQILAADPLLATPIPARPSDHVRATGTAARAASAPLRQLPAAPRLFTGRHEQFRLLTNLARRAPGPEVPGAAVLCAIDGMGGVGKTALALHAAHRLAERFPDGQLFVDLRGFTQGAVPRTADDALLELLGALGVAPGQVPAQADARAALYRERLSGTRTLVVLDNVRDEAQVLPLLPASGGCMAILTSRRRLKALDDAVPVPLEALAPGEAVALLHRSARTHLDHPAPADDARWEQIAELCGRLPLALVIAGALLRTGGKAWDLQRLTDRLSARRSGQELAGYTDGSRSLATVFDLSHQSLGRDGQLLFRRLGLLPGSELDAYAAAALLGVGLDEADLVVQRVAEESLLIGVAPGRYRIHDLVRVHARSLLTMLESGAERDAARDRLLRYYAHTAQRASLLVTRHPRPVPDGPVPVPAPALLDQEAARAWLRTEYPNLDAAFTHARAGGLDAHVVALSAGLAEILHTDGPWSHALEIHQAAAEAAERGRHYAAHALAIMDLGRVQFLTGDVTATGEAAAKALEIYREVGNGLGQADALTGLGRVRLMAGDFPGTLDAYTQALAIYQAADHRLGQATTLIELGRARQLAGDHQGAIEAFARAQEFYREAGRQDGQGIALDELGLTLFLTGDYPGAVESTTRALEIFREIHGRLGEANALHNLARVRAATADYGEADGLLARALEIYRSLGHRLGEANALNSLGKARASAGNHAGARDAQSRALEIYRQIGNRTGEAGALVKLGQLWHAAGQAAQAEDALTRALEFYRTAGSRSDEAWALNHYAALLATTGQPGRALTLYRQALDAHRELNKPDDAAISLEGIAGLLIPGQDPVEGAALLEEALAIYRRLGRLADIDRVQHQLRSLGVPPRT
ncbi:DNA-binding SARP family transcriptional activator [Catenulispora sp. GAS73]|uniref:AfsR/SARP family transcriptional regulator n=1 Tax=Catenulispora sp. GAS73 TaxID=3156269 RepID=UPI003511967F